MQLAWYLDGELVAVGESYTFRAEDVGKTLTFKPLQDHRVRYMDANDLPIFYKPGLKTFDEMRREYRLSYGAPSDKD